MFENQEEYIFRGAGGTRVVTFVQKDSMYSVIVGTGSGHDNPYSIPVCVLFFNKTFSKGMSPVYPPTISIYEQIEGQILLLVLVRQSISDKKYSEFKSSILSSKTDLLSHLSLNGEVK